MTIRFAGPEELASLSLRKAPAREGILRLIDVEDFDLSACGGTHVLRTGAIGIIAVAATERFKGGVRVTFLCGGRALDGYHALRDAVAGSVRALSVLPAELPVTIERLQADARDLRKQIKDQQMQLAAHHADALAEAAIDVGGVRLVATSLAGWDANGLKAIASRIAERPGHVAILVSEPPPGAIVTARRGPARTPVPCRGSCSHNTEAREVDVQSSRRGRRHFTSRRCAGFRQRVDHVVGVGGSSRQ